MLLFPFRMYFSINYEMALNDWRWFEYNGRVNHSLSVPLTSSFERKSIKFDIPLNILSIGILLYWDNQPIIKHVGGICYCYLSGYIFLSTMNDWSSFNHNGRVSHGASVQLTSQFRTKNGKLDLSWNVSIQYWVSFVSDNKLFIASFQDVF